MGASLKPLCLMTVTLCGLLVGLEFRRRLSVRADSLAMFRALFLEMKSMIAHSSLTLEDMMLELTDRQPDNRFICRTGEYIHEKPFRTAWALSLDELWGALCLTDGDIRLLQDCADLLGKSDVEGELNALSLIGERVSLAAEEARAKLDSDGKVYAAVGSSCGMILALLLL